MYMERVGRIDTVLQTFIDRVRTAQPGYAGLFDAVKIREDALDRVYAFDNGLLVYSEQIAVGLERFGEAMESSEGIDDVLDQLEGVVREISALFERRVETMKGLEQAV
jgi:hypothetical protein